ncbi:ribosomal protein S30-domain-containing protein [Xylaria acuta]|nr:ribosomal protein S30-domain-containing protein [Xylaria acuta]
MGKVHGSLARAGKVKSQTPKVEKQEKSKVPKGRAKKRLQVSYSQPSPYAYPKPCSRPSALP